MKTKKTFRGKWTIQQARKYLFERSKKHRNKSETYGWLSLICIVIIPFCDFIGLMPDCSTKQLINSKGGLSLIFGLLSIGSQIASWKYFLRYKKEGIRAREILKLEILYNISNRREIEALLFKYIPEIERRNKKENVHFYSCYNDEYFNTPKELNVYQEISYRILENCIWNRHLYKKMREKDGRIILGFIFFVSLLFFISLLLPFIVNNIPDDLYMKFVYLVGLIVVSSLSFNFFERHKNLKIVISSIDNLVKDLYSARIETDAKFLQVYNSYTDIILKSPDIPDKIYKENKDILNKSWEEINKNLPLTNTSLAIKEVLPIIKSILDENQIEWAVTGSASKFLKGESIYCGDIDILLANQGDYTKVNKLFNVFLVEEIQFCHSQDIKSFYGKFNMGGINIDIICDVENYTSYGWIKHPNFNKKHITFYKEKYPVTTDDFEKKVFEIINKKSNGK